MPISRRKFSGRRLVPKNRQLLEEKLAIADATVDYSQSMDPHTDDDSGGRMPHLDRPNYQQAANEEPVLVPAASNSNLMNLDNFRDDEHQSEADDLVKTQPHRDTTVIPLSKESVAREEKEEPSFGVVGVARTPGDMLVEARKAKNLSIAEVADGLNLKADVVQALEEDRSEDIPGTTYARGYLRTYARYLNIDDNLITSWFEDSSNSGEERPAQITNTRSSATDKHRTRGFGSVMMLLATVSVASALWFGYQQDWFSRAIADKPGDAVNRVKLGPEGDRPESVELNAQNAVIKDGDQSVTVSESSDSAQPVAAKTAEETETVLRANDSQEINFGSTVDSAQPPSEPVDTQIETGSQPLGDSGVQAPASRLESEPSSEPSLAEAELSESQAESAPASSPSVQPSVPAETDVVAVTVESSETESSAVVSSTVNADDNYRAVATGASATSEATVVLRGKSDSWVEVSDASGHKIFLDMVHTNETYNVVGTPPFRLLIGNAPGVDVEYEGFWVDVLGNTNDNNIARLILGQQSG